MLHFYSLFLSATVLLLRRCNGVPTFTPERLCSNLNRVFITRAFNDMIPMVQTAHDRMASYLDGTSTAGESRVVVNNFDTYFGLNADGLDFRISHVFGRLLWVVRFSNIMKLTS